MAMGSVQGQGAGGRFEITSIKRNDLPPQARRLQFGCERGRFISRAQSIERAIRYAYGIEEFQLEGLPDWAQVGAEVYDIEGRASADTTGAQCREMVKALFADRFQLVVRRSTREVPVFALVVDTNGPKMREVVDGDEVNGPGFVINGQPMQMFDRQLKGWTMAQLVQALGIAQLGRPIVDKTGLEGLFRISLSFQQRGSVGDGPDVTTALRGQLGLRLESQRGQIEVVTITNLERPSEN